MFWQTQQRTVTETKSQTTECIACSCIFSGSPFLTTTETISQCKLRALSRVQTALWHVNQNMGRDSVSNCVLGVHDIGFFLTTLWIMDGSDMISSLVHKQNVNWTNKRFILVWFGQVVIQPWTSCVIVCYLCL